MTHIKKWAGALCLVLLCSSYSNSQAAESGTTGNLINYGTSPTDTTSIWNNGVYVNQLGCFGGDSSTGHCGPNPNVNRYNGAINFSYGQVNLNQIVNINKALEAGGAGVQLSGFNFGFTAKNGNGWDDGRQDYLSAYVKLNGANGNTLATYDYTSATDRRYNWTQFNFSETFATPYTASKLSTAQVGFVGRDNNYWAGPYGPEIINVNFSLAYSVKPAAPVVPVQPAYAPPPPGPLPTESSPGLAQTSPQQQAQQPPPAPPPPDTNQNSGAAQDNPAQPSPTQAGPAPTNPQPAGGPPQTSTASSSSSTSSSSAGPSKLAMSVVKSAQDKDKATQAQAVQNAAKTLENTQQSSQASSNAAISMNQDMSANSATAAATFAGQTTQASAQTATAQSSQQQQTQQSGAGPQQNNRIAQQVQQQEVQQAQTQATANLVQILQPKQEIQQVQQQAFVNTAPAVQPMYIAPVQQQEATSTSVVVLKPAEPAAAETVQPATVAVSSMNRNLFTYNPFNTTSVMSSAPVVNALVEQPKFETKQTEFETVSAPATNFGATNRAGNPIGDLMPQGMELPQTAPEQRTETVKREVQSNELAGGVDIASMATTPAGFTAYSIVLKDTAFYAPKEVYKNQRTVDNARVLRGLTGGSDAKHQEIVNSQYK